MNSECGDVKTSSRFLLNDCRKKLLLLIFSLPEQKMHHKLIPKKQTQHNHCATICVLTFLPESILYSKDKDGLLVHEVIELFIGFLIHAFTVACFTPIDSTYFNIFIGRKNKILTKNFKKYF